MKHFYQTAMALLLSALLTLGVFAASEALIPGGNTVGLHLQTEGVSVVEVSSQAGKKAGLRAGDVLQKINGNAVSSPQEVVQAVQSSQGAALKLSILRGGKEKQCTLAPEKTKDGWRLGISVRDGLCGIGTVTYYDPADGSFGALGHGVNEGKSLLPMEEGEVLPATVAAVVKGKQGEPGALKGAVTDDNPLGTVMRNTSRGIFGTMTCPAGEALPVAAAKEICIGAAEILSNVEGTQVKRYAVEITELHPEDSQCRNLLLRVTDPELLDATGGIVQGMSGSPIIQNGKLIGAVTHVLVNDPTTGYGIFIENMLAAAG